MMMIDFEGVHGTLHISNETLAGLSAPMLVGIRGVIERALRDSGKHVEDIDQVILVGGSCYMPLVQRYVSKLLRDHGRNSDEIDPLVLVGGLRTGGLNRNTDRPIASPFSGDPQPDTVVALGVGVYAGIKARGEEIRDILLTDICPFTLGVAVHNSQNPSKPLMSTIIERNTTLPCSKIERYSTVYNRQKAIEVNIYQGEEMYADENILLDRMEIGIPPGTPGKESVDVRFTYDINGLLDVDIIAVSTSRKVSKVIRNKSNRMSARDIELKRKELAALKIDPLEVDENRFLVARAQRLYMETTGVARNLLMHRLNGFLQVISSNKQVALLKEKPAFSAFLDSIEESLFSFREDDDRGE